ncbi:Putative acetyltransferase SA2342 [Serratia marcescens]|uniref:Acetyltransferase n=1 Tax=Serratia marcescens TaxID=615 RepID=A0A379YG31_SERMA|nr:Putative acetyltransferase SA2342 [Serratia marcescens]
MTEREKLLSGLEYNSRDEELIALYHRARALTKSLEALDSHQADEKNRLLGELFGSWGEASWIETPFWCDYGQHVRIGKNCFINVNAVFLDCNTITIGDNTLIGPQRANLHAESSAEGR